VTKKVSRQKTQKQAGNVLKLPEGQLPRAHSHNVKESKKILDRPSETSRRQIGKAKKKEAKRISQTQRGRNVTRRRSYQAAVGSTETGGCITRKARNGAGAKEAQKGEKRK